jgi:lysophospholipase L1-like esterase
VTGAVFYDENGNGQIDAVEGTRVPDVMVEIAGRTARTSKVLGEFTIDGVPAGTHAVTVRAGSLPPYYTPPSTPVTVTVPLTGGQNAIVPLGLPIAPSYRPNVYMGFGDSITIGQGSSDDLGYRSRLEEKLRAHFGRGTVVNEGVDATRSNRGAERIDQSLARARPAYTLINYGTNDYNVGECKSAPPCFTIDSLRDIVLSARGSQSLPILSTIIPGNPDSVQQPDRNLWVSAQDARIRALAREMKVPLADPEALFLKEPNPGGLYRDHIHPNDRGYELLAQAFFAAIAGPVESAASSLSMPELFLPPTGAAGASDARARPSDLGARRHRAP